MRRGGDGLFVIPQNACSDRLVLDAGGTPAPPGVSVTFACPEHFGSVGFAFGQERVDVKFFEHRGYARFSHSWNRLPNRLPLHQTAGFKE